MRHGSRSAAVPRISGVCARFRHKTDVRLERPGGMVYCGRSMSPAACPAEPLLHSRNTVDSHRKRRKNWKLAASRQNSYNG